jgi:hypothetical protein
MTILPINSPAGVSYPQWPASLNSAAGGLVARYDFASDKNLTLSGPEITGVTDLSGNGHDLAPPTSAKRPLYLGKVLNGLGAALFTKPSGIGSSELKAPALGLAGDFTYCFVVSGGTDLFALFDGNQAVKGTRFYNNNQIDFCTGAGIALQSFTGDAAGTNIIVTVGASGGTVTGNAYKSGTLSASGSASSADIPELNAFALGSINGSPSYDFYAHELAIFQGIFSSGERLTWDSYALSKWSI